MLSLDAAHAGAHGLDPGPQLSHMDYDYALLELHRPHRRPHMKLMAAPAVEEMAGKRINFSGFDSDWLGELGGGRDGPPHLPAP